MTNGNQRIVVMVAPLAGGFAEDKDIARKIREESILPSLKDGREVVLDFKGVAVATQSFIHALISEALRIHNGSALSLLEFKSCSRTVKSVVLTVIEYSLAGPNTPQNA